MRRLVLLAVVASVGCAQISTTPVVHTRPVPGARPLSSERRVVERQLEARWLQRGDTLSVTLLEHRRCQVVERVAAVREERSVRRADAAIYFEYGLAAVLLGLAAFSFARPELFAAPETDDTGRMRRDPKTGYALGGVFGSLGAVALGAGIYDSVRARDRVVRAETVALRQGPASDCDAPTLPASQRQVELQLGAFRGHGVTDLAGQVRFSLPGPELWPAPEPEPAAAPVDAGGFDPGEAPRPGPRSWRGTLRTGIERSVAIDVVVPYDATLAAPRVGTAMSVAR